MALSRYLSTITCMAALMLSGSCSSGKTDYESAVLEWTGREIVFPDSLSLVGGGTFVKEPSDFTIVAYYDSKGCTGCRMRLPKWVELMHMIDSESLYDVDVCILTGGHIGNDLRITLNQLGLGQNVIVDDKNLFQQSNNLEEAPELQTFLLDSENKVLLVGNPLDMPPLKPLYMRTLGITADTGLSEEFGGRLDFGMVKAGRRVDKTIRLHNGSGHAIQIEDIESSCPCTEAKVSSWEIPPESAYDLTVFFKDTIPGPFERMVKLRYKDGSPDKFFIVTGEVVER